MKRIRYLDDESTSTARRTARLIERMKNLPPMTARQAEEQRMDFAYGNLYLTERHRPSRKVFASLCKDRGWTDMEFELWAFGKEWW